ncbi:aminopeptidase [Breznakiella homolactica]|uniref:Aminopeptidase n=2 Tax=Breznakiella homolactica TaxID=2798577 RepID=A0A7T7XRS7_9SPIR|nr:aminopeptidase [Breznakiella homolactica]
MKFSTIDAVLPELREAARIAVDESLKVKPGEQVLIVTNPQGDVSRISQAIYDAALDAGANPVLLYQPVKTQLDFAEPAVIAAFEAEPSVFISLSAEKLGKDRKGIAAPYRYNGESWDHIFHLQMYGRKTCRAFWSPSTTVESFIRTVPIDYGLLKRQCDAIKKVLDAAAEITVTAPAGTDIRFGLRKREAKSDDGDFSRGGRGGNLPAGESFISPENGTAQGTIAFDGSISLHDGDIVIREPIRCTLDRGFITEISGGTEADALLNTVTLAEKNAQEYEKQGKLPPGAGAVYARNARHIGEIGIGLNPKARITGSMLEDEKAFNTCHFAVGLNYDGDAPSLIHLDGLVTNPTITAIMEDGSRVIIEENGNLTESFRG